MNYFSFADADHREALNNMFVQYFQKRIFVPFIGSGFTKGMSARNGHVPSVTELREKLMDVISRIKGYGDSSRKALEKDDLSKLSDRFWRALAQSESPEQLGDDSPFREEFENYINSNFTGVYDISESKRQLINSCWRYIYTFNYDDAIENASAGKLQSIFPYRTQGKSIRKSPRIIKLHGDAQEYHRTGDSNYCILSRGQYVDALTDSENHQIIDDLLADFASNNIIFMGCSLTDELDMLYAGNFKLEEAKRTNKLTHCYYTRYVETYGNPLTPTEEDLFDLYAITDIIEVSAKEMETFYSFIANASKQALELRQEDELSHFTGFTFAQHIPPCQKEDTEYLYYSSKIQPDANCHITLPSFFVHRDTTTELINSINNKEAYIYVLRGSRLCGKTYILIDLVKHFNAANTYYFPSIINSISDDCLDKMLNKKDTILIFDANSLSPEQIEQILQWKKRLIAFNIRIVTAVDRSLGMFTRHFFEARHNMEDIVKIFDVSSYFSANELNLFNKVIAKYGFRDRNESETFLDYMFSISGGTLEANRHLLPPINVIHDRNTLKAMVLLANQESVLVSQSTRMRLNTGLVHLSEQSKEAVQLDYLTELELQNDTHDSQRYISNSQYWVFRCLAAYASDKSHFDSIATAFFDIVQDFRRIYGIGTFYDRTRAYKDYTIAVKPYIFLDTIQFIFAQHGDDGGPLLLATKIYNRLQPLFSGDFQFLHQKAKCHLWSSKRAENNKEREKQLTDAGRIIERAQDIVDKIKPYRSETTLFHMAVTKALIKVNRWRFCRDTMSDVEQNEFFTELLTSFNEFVYSPEFALSVQERDFAPHEMRDIKWFISSIISENTESRFTDAQRENIESIIAILRNVGLFQTK